MSSIRGGRANWFGGANVLAEYPRWRAFLEKAGEHLESTRDDADPLQRLAGALAFVRQGVSAPQSQSERHEHHFDADLEIREVGGEQALQFTLEDPQLGDVSCRLLKTDTGILAVFQAKDVNTERLLQAEVGRLRVQLEGKGLRVSDIKVERAG